MKILTISSSLLFGLFSLFAQNEKRASITANTTFALIVGVSNYQDAEIPDLKYAQRDAEAFAAYLQSPSGGSVPKDNIKLLTSSDATNAKFGAALDWLFEQSIIADKAIVYLTGYGDTEISEKEGPSYFLLADSPLTPLQAGTFEVKQVLQVLDDIFYKRNPNFLFVANLSPLILPQGIGYQPVKMKDGDKVDFSNSVSCKFITPDDLDKSPDQVSQSRFTLNHLLLDGMLGFADKNEDGEVSFREMKKFFQNATPVEQRWPGLLFLAVGSQRLPIAQVDAASFKKLQMHGDGLFPSIVHLETTEREDKILENVPENVHLMYQDFILTIKLGQLLKPEDRCASFFYDQLKTEPALDKLHSDMRRKLAAALQDEVQQALNAYLKLDNSELERRGNNIEPYQLYANYMARSIELFGARNFMSNIMQAKYHYFNGLVARMQAVNGQPELFEKAISEQQLALEYESAAAFIYNELGVIYSYQGKFEEAIQQFELALEYSPNWGIPYSNLCIIYTNQRDYVKAISHGKEAFRRAPRNIFVTGTLANAYAQSGELDGAAKLFEIVVEKDPKNYPAFYNLACIHALRGEWEAAISILEQALETGFSDYNLIQKDPDLAALRERKEIWDDLMKKYFPDRQKE